MGLKSAGSARANPAVDGRPGAAAFLNVVVVRYSN
jgi:hypothetical protein